MVVRGFCYIFMQGGKLPYINIADKVKDNNRHRYISINFQCCHGIKLQLYVYFGGVITLKKLLPITVNYCQSAIENQKKLWKKHKNNKYQSAFIYMSAKTKNMSQKILKVFKKIKRRTKFAPTIYI